MMTTLSDIKCLFRRRATSNLFTTNIMKNPDFQSSTDINGCLRQAALRRNLGTAAVLTLALSGGPFGISWLAATSGATFIALLTARLVQLQVARKTSSTSTH